MPSSMGGGGELYRALDDDDELKDGDEVRGSTGTAEEETSRCFAAAPCCWCNRGTCRAKTRRAIHRRRAASCCVAACVAVGVAVGVPAIVEWGYRADLKADVDLTAKGATYDAFTSNTDRSGQPIRYSVYYFDLQNADAVLGEEAATPVLVERGPYSYDERFEMFDISFERNDGLMRFFERKWYVFDPAASCEGCNDTADVITTVDLVAIEFLEMTLPGGALGASAAGQDALLALLCETRNNRASPFFQTTVHAAHWGHWGDPTLKAAETLLTDLNVSVPSLSTSHVPGFESNYSSEAQVRRAFGARDGVRTRGAKSMRYEIYMGSRYVRVCLSPTIPGDDATKTPAECAPQDPAWDALDEQTGEALAAEQGWTLAYATRHASRVKGASPTFVKPLELNRGHFGRGLFYASPQRFEAFASTTYWSKGRKFRGPQSLHVFIDAVYRELKFSRTLRDGEISRRGIPLERYELDRGRQDDAAGPGDPYDQISTPHGVLNVTRAVGFPLYASQPHFFDSAPELAGGVIGLTPNRAVHNTYVDVEPRSGEIFAARERLQFVASLFNYPQLAADRSASVDVACGARKYNYNWTAFPSRVGADGTALNHDGFYYPIGYIDQGYDLPHKDAKDLDIDLLYVDALCDAFFLGFLAIAAVCAGFALSAFIASVSVASLPPYGGPPRGPTDDDDDDAHKPPEGRAATRASWSRSAAPRTHTRSCGRRWRSCWCRPGCCRLGGGGASEGLLHAATEPGGPRSADDDDAALPGRASELSGIAGDTASAGRRDDSLV